MARERVVSRTIKVAQATALCLDTETAEPCNITVPISATIKDEKGMLKAVKKAIETDTLKVAKIVDVKVEEALYKMPEEDFVKLATKVQ